MIRRKIQYFLSLVRINYPFVYLTKKSPFLTQLLLKHGWKRGDFDYYEKVFARFKNNLAEAGINFKDKSVLKVGAGSGRLGEILISQGGSKSYCGIDRHRVDNEINISKNESDSKNDKLSFYNYDFTKPDINLKHKFDLIISNAVMEHIPKEKIPSVIENMQRILKPGGYMAHQIDLRDHVCFEKYLDNLRFSNEKWEKITGGTIFYTNRYKLSDYKTFFSAYGFENVYIKKRFTDNFSYIDNLDINPDLTHLSAEDLKLTGSFIIAKKH